MALRKPNEWQQRSDGVVEITLTKGKIALVDEEDLALVLPHRWYALSSGRTQWYARSDTRLSKKDCIRLLMHRLLLKVPLGMITDHRNGNGLDNRRANLRVATHTQSNANSAKRNGCTSRFKGVSYYRSTGKWVSGIRVHGKLIRLGYFGDEIDAAIAYNEAATKYQGEFARLNDVALTGQVPRDLLV